MASLNAEAIANVLGKARRSGGGFMCCCPAHDDQNPSLFISDGPNGDIIAKCFASCTTENVRAALRAKRLWPEAGKRRSAVSADMRKERRRREQDFRILTPVPSDAPELDWGMLSLGDPTAVYDYRNARGELLMRIYRQDRLTGEKIIRPLVYAEARSGKRSWYVMSLPTPIPLYGLDHLATSPEALVLVVEGEKTADAARRLFPDYSVVTWSGGANASQKSDWSPLRGRKVVLWPDNDEPGRKAMDQIAAVLKPLAASVGLVNLPSFVPDKWDLADPAPDCLGLSALLTKAVSAGAGLRRHILSAKDFLDIATPPREYLIREWLPKGALAMVWATRGLGKTWFALTLAISIASGENFLDYEVPNEEVVLFIDGEMALGELQDRISRLADEPPERLHILPSEMLFAAGVPLNINDPADQQKLIDAIDELAREGIRPSLIILDNLSSLTAGLDENDNSALDGIIRWLLRLRHAGVTVLFVHHANKSGDQRGASRREDQLDTSIKLASPDNAAGTVPLHDGAHFIMEFTKVRGRKPRPLSIELKLIEKPDGKTVWSMSSSRIMPRDHVLRIIATRNPRTQDEIAAETNRAKGTVSKDCQALERAGLITRDPPRLTDLGRGHALEVFPELASILYKQGDLGI